jgi:hypothetical protein
MSLLIGWLFRTKNQRSDCIKCSVADLLIGGVGINRQNLVTRNATDLRHQFSTICDPGAEIKEISDEDGGYYGFCFSQRRWVV